MTLTLQVHSNEAILSILLESACIVCAPVYCCKKINSELLLNWFFKLVGYYCEIDRRFVSNGWQIGSVAMITKHMAFIHVMKRSYFLKELEFR